MFPAMTYFRTGGHYHRPWKLNCRVRNGNECGLPGIVTGIRYEGLWTFATRMSIGVIRAVQLLGKVQLKIAGDAVASDQDQSGQAFTR